MFRGAQVQLNSTLLAAGKGERRNVQCSPFCRVDYFDVPFVARMAHILSQNLRNTRFHEAPQLIVEASKTNT